MIRNREVLALILEAGIDGFTPQELHRVLGGQRLTIYPHLHRLEEAGAIRRTGIQRKLCGTYGNLYGEVYVATNL